jgi:hypothetical protein
VIKSTDSFEDVWGPALACLKRYWPDCPFPVYTVSESKPWGTIPLLVGHNGSWSKNLYVALSRIKQNYVLMWLDDMLLCEPIDTKIVQSAYDKLNDNPLIGAVRLGPGGETWGFTDDPHFAQIERSSSYRISTSPTLWHKHFLKKVLVCTGTAWDFELHGTMIAREMPEEILLPKLDPPFHPVIKVLYTAITRGQWEEGALNWLQRVGIPVNPNHPIKGYSEGQKWPKV